MQPTHCCQLPSWNVGLQVLYALFAYVLKRRRKRSRAASAAAHFREQRQGSAMAVMWEHMLAGRHRRRQAALADEQRARSLLARALSGWMQLLQEHEVRVCVHTSVSACFQL